MGRIIIGVDGSDESFDALRFGLEEARLHHDDVTVVTAFKYPALAMVPRPEDPPTPPQVLREARGLVERLLEKVTPPPGVNVEAKAVEGGAAVVLLSEARDAGADLLVVGARGRGGFRGLALGSVSNQCATHATCPVAIVHHGR